MVLHRFHKSIVLLLSVFLFQGCFTIPTNRKIVGAPIIAENSALKSAKWNSEKLAEFIFEENPLKTEACIQINFYDLPVSLKSIRVKDPRTMPACEDSLHHMVDLEITDPSPNALLVFNNRIYVIESAQSLGGIFYVNGFDSDHSPIFLHLYDYTGPPKETPFSIGFSDGTLAFGKLQIDYDKDTIRNLNINTSAKMEFPTENYKIRELPGSGIVVLGNKHFSWQNEKVRLVRFPESFPTEGWRVLPENAILSERKKDAKFILLWPFSLAGDIIIAAGATALIIIAIGIGG